MEFNSIEYMAVEYIADSTSQCNKIGSKPNVTKRSPKSSITTLNSECDSNMKENSTSRCNSEGDIDSKSSTTTSSQKSSENVTDHDSRHDTIINLGLDRNFAKNYILGHHLSDRLVEYLNKQSSKRTKMSDSWNSTNFDLRSVLSAPASPGATISSSKNELDLPSVPNHKLNLSERKSTSQLCHTLIKNDDDFDLRSVLSESPSQQAIPESVFDFGSISHDEVGQLERKQVKYRHRYEHVYVKDGSRYDPDFDLRAVITESSSKSTSESVLDVKSNYNENLGRKQVDYHFACYRTNNGYHYDPDFDLRSVLSESSSPNSTCESVLDFESIAVNFSENFEHKQYDYPPRCNPTKNSYHSDPDFDLRSILSESSHKPESVLDFESIVTNYTEDLAYKQANNHPPRNPTKNNYHYDPDFDLRSTISESPSPKPTSESKLDFESEEKYKVIPSESKQAANPPRCNPEFDLRYVLDARKSDITSEKFTMRQRIFPQSVNKLNRKHRYSAEVKHSCHFQPKKKEMMTQQRSRPKRRKRFLEKVYIGDNVYPIKQELDDADDTPSSVTEFLRKMRNESDKKKDLKS